MGNIGSQTSDHSLAKFSVTKCLPDGFVMSSSDSPGTSAWRCYGQFYGKPAICEAVHDNEVRWYNTLRTWAHCIELWHLSTLPTGRKRLIVIPNYAPAAFDKRMFDVLMELHSRRIVHNEFTPANVKWNPISNRIVMRFSPLTWRVPVGDVIPYTDMLQVLIGLSCTDPEIENIRRQLLWYARIHHEAFGVVSAPLIQLVRSDDFDIHLFAWEHVLPMKLLLARGVSTHGSSLAYRYRVFPIEAFELPSTFDFISFARRLLFNRETKFNALLQTIDDTFSTEYFDASDARRIQ